jgi:hypothetical protein
MNYELNKRGIAHINSVLDAHIKPSTRRDVVYNQAQHRADEFTHSDCFVLWLSVSQTLDGIGRPIVMLPEHFDVVVDPAPEPDLWMWYGIVTLVILFFIVQYYCYLNGAT